LSIIREVRWGSSGGEYLKLGWYFKGSNDRGDYILDQRGTLKEDIQRGVGNRLLRETTSLSPK
jgi:hypothetical protein